MRRSSALIMLEEYRAELVFMADTLHAAYALERACIENNTLNITEALVRLQALRAAGKSPRRQRRTPAYKAYVTAMAVRLGPRAASRATGVPVGTVTHWMKLAGVRTEAGLATLHKHLGRYGARGGPRGQETARQAAQKEIAALLQPRP